VSLILLPSGKREKGGEKRFRRLRLFHMTKRNGGRASGKKSKSCLYSGRNKRPSREGKKERPTTLNVHTSAMSPKDNTDCTEGGGELREPRIEKIITEINQAGRSKWERDKKKKTNHTSLLQYGTQKKTKPRSVKVRGKNSRNKGKNNAYHFSLGRGPRREAEKRIR